MVLYLWQIIFQLLYGIPCTILYISIVYLFLNPYFKEKFKSTFFKLSVALAFVDLSNYIITWGIFKFTAFTPTAQYYVGTDDSILYPIGRFLSYYLTAVRCFLLVISSINRATAITLPSKHKILWTKYWKLIIIFCFIAPLPYTFQTLFGTTSINVSPFPITVLIYVNAAWFPLSPALINAVQSVSTAILTCFFNLITLILLKKKTKFGKINLNKIEIGLTFICCWDFLTNMIFAIYNCIIFWDRKNNAISTSFIKLTLIVWIYDLNNLSRPLLFIFMCKNVKFQIFAIFQRSSKFISRNKSNVPPIVTIT